MNNTRNYLITLLCGIVFIALLYQIVSGWDTLQFLLRAIFGVALTLLVWRSGILVSRGYAGTGAGRRLALQAVCWAVVAVALFAAFGLGR